MTRLFLIAFLVFFSFNLYSQSEKSQIETALQHYIQGTSYNDIDRIEKAFYTDANLYLENKNKEFNIVTSSEYIGWFKNGTLGKFNGRIGNIISIDQFQGIAIAKAEILLPKHELSYIDLFLLKKLNNEWKIISKSAQGKKSNKKGHRVLFIVSNAHFYGDSQLATGNSYSEIVSAYNTFSKAGYTIDFVSPEGGSIPLAYINTSDPLQKEYLYNADFMYALKNTKTPNEITPELYKAVHYVGGGSAMFGVPENKEIQSISMSVYENYDGIISSVCHGTAGIVHLKTKDGNYLVDGKNVNGYPDSFENPKKEYFKQFPFLIQKTIEERGGTFIHSPRNTAHVQVDGNLVTGQNYLSSKGVAEKIIEMLAILE